MKKSPLALAQFWIVAIGSAGVIVGGYFVATSGGISLVVIASVAMIIGSALMKPAVDRQRPRSNVMPRAR